MAAGMMIPGMFSGKLSTYGLPAFFPVGLPLHDSVFHFDGMD